MLVCAEGTEVLPAAGVYDLHLAFLHQAVLGGGPPDHAVRFGR